MRRPPSANKTVGRPRWIGGWLFCASLFLLCCSFSPPAAAEHAPNGHADVPQQPKAKPVSISDIGVQSQRTKRLLREIADTLGQADSVASVEEEVPALRERVETQKSESEATRLKDPSLLALDQLRTMWTQISAELDVALKELRERADELDQIRKANHEKQRIWEATRAEVVVSGADPTVLTQIDEVLEAIDQTGARGKERQAAVLTLQSDVAKLSETVREDINRIDEIRKLMMGSIFNQDRAALWSGDFWKSFDRSEVDERLKDQQDSKLKSAQAFFERRKEALLLHAIATILFCALMFYLRPTVHERLGDDESIAGVRSILDGPISFTATGSFLFAFLWISPESSALTPFLAAAALIPAIVVLRKIVDPRLFPMMNALVIYFIIDRFRELVAPLQAIPRAIFIFQMLLAIAALTYWLRPARLRDIPPELARGPVFRAVGAGMRIALFGAIVALIGEAAGFTELAHIVGRTIAASGYAAVALYAGVQVFEGMTIFLLRARPLRLLGMVQRERLLIRQRVGKVLRLGAWILWLMGTLWAAELLGAASSLLSGILAAKLPLPEIEIGFGDLLAAVITFWAALLLSRFIRFFLAEDVFTRVRLPKGRPYAISTLIHYTILILGFTLAGSTLGIDLNRFTLIAGAFGVGIGFGLQNIVNNFVSGIILLTERPVEVGDTVSLGEVFGQVERIGIRSSTVRTWQGAEVILPNAHLVSEQVTNWTLSDRRRRLEIPVGVAYGSNPRRVIEVLLQVAQNQTDLLPEPEPYVLFHNFGDSSLDFELRAWTGEFDRFQRVRSELCLGISDALAEAGIQIPFPQRDLHLKTAGTEEAKSLSLPATPPVQQGTSPAIVDGDGPE